MPLASCTNPNGSARLNHGSRAPATGPKIELDRCVLVAAAPIVGSENERLFVANCRLSSSLALSSSFYLQTFNLSGKRIVRVTTTMRVAVVSIGPCEPMLANSLKTTTH